MAARRRRGADRSRDLTTLLTFGRPTTVEDGGSARLAAIADGIERRGGRVLDLAAVAPGRPVPLRAIAMGLVLLRTLLLLRTRNLHLEYPGFPAIGVYYPTAAPTAITRARCALAYGIACATVVLARVALHARGRRLIVGIGDVPSMELDLPDRGRLGSARWTHRYERLLLGSADAVWVVTPEERDELERRYGSGLVPFVIVPNGNHPVPEVPERPVRDEVEIVYAGSLYRDRASLTEAIGVALARSTRPVKVTLAGPGGEWVDAAFAGDARVTWLGTISERACFDLASRGDIGLLVYFDDEPYYEIVHPTKLSLYVASTIPIVSGDARYVARFVREHGIGVAATREGFAAALLGLIEDADARRTMQARAAAMRDEVFWDTILGRAFAETTALTQT